jgi:HEAT repeat protein
MEAGFYGQPGPFLMKRLAAGAALLLLVASVAAFFEPTGTVRGKLRGEKFYGGRPTSTWRRELCDPAPGAQTNAVMALADGKAEAVPVLIDLLHTGDADGGTQVRLMAALALGHVGPEAEPAVPALTELLSDPSADVRVAAAEALGKVGPAARPAVPAMAALLKEDQPARVVRVLKALRRLPGANHEAIPAFVEATRHADAETRENAAEALGEAGDAARDAVPALRPLLEDQNEKVREQAAVALKNIEKQQKNEKEP